MEEEYIALDCFFGHMPDEVEEPKEFLLTGKHHLLLHYQVDCILKFCGKGFKRLFSILSWSTGPSYLQHNRYIFSSCQQVMKRKMCCLVSDLYLKDVLTHSFGRIRGSMWKLCTVVATEVFGHVKLGTCSCD